MLIKNGNAYSSKYPFFMYMNLNVLQVDLTEYQEKHEFVFDAVLNEEVSNDEVIISHDMNLY